MTTNTKTPAALDAQIAAAQEVLSAAQTELAEVWRSIAAAAPPAADDAAPSFGSTSVLLPHSGGPQLEALWAEADGRVGVALLEVNRLFALRSEADLNVLRSRASTISEADVAHPTQRELEPGREQRTDAGTAEQAVIAAERELFDAERALATAKSGQVTAFAEGGVRLST